MKKTVQAKGAAHGARNGGRKAAARAERQPGSGTPAEHPAKRVANAHEHLEPVPPQGGRRVQVRRSGVHGRGVFAVQPLAAGERIFEYVGEVITWKEALRRHPHDPNDPHHTFYFHLDEGHVIDAKHGGNSSRWINHSCDPNCESDQDGGRVYIHALRDIAAGEELFYDYGLVIDERYTPKLKREYACRCGAAECRGTMLAPKRGGRR